jgi:hypothetical protein
MTADIEAFFATRAKMPDKREVERRVREQVREEHPSATPYDGRAGNLLDLQEWHVREHEKQAER